jgi:hypothetical protein
VWTFVVEPIDILVLVPNWPAAPCYQAQAAILFIANRNRKISVFVPLLTFLSRESVLERHHSRNFVWTSSST